MGLDKPVEYGIDRRLGPLVLLTSPFHGGNRKHDQNCGRYPKMLFLQCSPHLGKRKTRICNFCAPLIVIHYR